MAFLDEHLQPAEKRLREEKKARDLRLGKTVPSNVFRLPDRTTTPVKVIPIKETKEAEAVPVLTEEELREQRLQQVKTDITRLRVQLKNLEMEDATQEPPVYRPPVNTIIHMVAAFYKLSINDLLSQRRTQNLCRPRQIVMHLAKELTLLSLPQIGRRLGDRDHTTILSGIRRIAALLPNDPRLASDIAQIQSMLMGQSND